MLKLFSAFRKEKIWDFDGGIHPPEMKTQSSGTPLRQIPLATRFVMPLKQHIGAEGELCVKEGDTVLRGQPLTFGRGRMLPIHAPTSGKVVAITPHTVAHPSALSELSVIIEADGEDRWIERDGWSDYRARSREALIDRIHQFGVAGLGGAGFPTGVKLRGGGDKIQTLIINAAECEPYITADDTLARGAVKLSKQKVIVKHLDAIQNFGAMDILCTDKTGTLTQDKIVLENHTDIAGKTSERVLHSAWLNSHYQTGLKNLLDVAVLEGVDEESARSLSGRWQKVDEIPFDFERRRMSVVVSEQPDVHQLICKGALQEILNVSTQVHYNGDIVPLDDTMLRRIKRVTDNLNRQGLRVVAVASKFLPAREGDYQRIDESDLILEGYIAFLDPPKETTAPALKALKASGITVKILTGDSELVAAKVCHEVGLDAGDVVVGSDIEHLSDDELAQLARHTTLFARLTPMHKERIVTLLKCEGHVVGFMGDGINDAPALRAADIGISVDGAVDIAREAADIILLEKSLMVLEEGVIEGRRTFANMLKYIKMTASSNFGNVFSVLVASAFLPFLPMLPLHLLIQNLMYDVSQVAIPFDNVDDEQIQKPQRWNPADLGRFMLFFGPISSIFDILTFCLMWFVFHANTPEHQTLFQSGWFVVGLLSQTLIVHMIRTRRIPFIQSRAAWPLIVMTGIVMALGIALPFSPLASYLQLQALPLSYFPWLVAILAGYMVLTQMVKGFYARRYGWQ